jgi:hypothetical protein
MSSVRRAIPGTGTPPLSWGARFSAIADKATSGFEPLLREKADDEGQSPEPSLSDVPELNPFLVRILERVKASDPERAR